MAMSIHTAVEAFIAEQRGLLGRLEAFVKTPGFERLCKTLRRAGDAVDAASVHTWKDAMNAIHSSRRFLRFDGIGFYGHGGAYSPAYVLVPV